MFAQQEEQTYTPQSQRIINDSPSAVSPTQIRMTEEELENAMTDFANEDSYYTKTMTRLVVENFLSKFSWYNPRKDMANAPSLSKAYAYYEHVTLPRRFVGQQTADHVLRRAEPGETQPTELYSPLRTPSNVFSEWGIGMDLYMTTVRIFSFVFLCCGLIHLPNQIFYRSTDYSPDGKSALDFALKGSAACTTTEWARCVDCTPDQWSTDEEKERFAFSAADPSMVFVKRNACDYDNLLAQGMVNFVVLFFLVAVLVLLSLYLGAREVRFDEDKVTSTDYSIIVKNPPKDAYNPDEWRDFFAQFAEKQVTAVTIALNNDVMLRKLIARRTHRNNLRLMLPKGIDMDEEDAVRVAVAQLVFDRDLEPRGCLRKLFDCTVLPILNIFNMLLPPETLVDRVFQLTDEIKELQGEKYEVSKVFVTFETEEGQRAALSALSIGRLDIMMNNKSKSGALFKDQLLSIGEPSEPSAVRWLDLSASTFHKVFMRGLNLGLTIAIVAFAGYLVTLARYNTSLGSWAAAPLVSVFNALIPMIVKILMIFEPHGTEGSFQTALYMKITLFRWVNTALLIKVITPWVSTLAEGKRDVLPQISAILWSELWIVPGLRLLDLYGNFKKHILAPRSRTQQQMNMNFGGTNYNLGERYTDLTKVLFVCFYYSALYPAAFFFGAAILIVQYYVDKFCLMRIWSNSALLGSEVAKFSRTYFFSGAVLAYAIISAYAWAGFPYDNVCDPVTNTAAEQGSIANINVVFGDGKSGPIEVELNRAVVYCDQSWRGFKGFLFPPTADKQPDNVGWMTKSQESLTDIYGYTSLAFVVGFIVLFFGNAIKNYVKSWIMGVYEPTGQKQHIDFSANTEIFAYVPQIKVSGFPFPFLACDIDQTDQGLIGWNDSVSGYDVHNLIFDLPWEGMPRHKLIHGNTRDAAVIKEHDEYAESSQRNPDKGSDKPPIELVKPLFSVIKHYPPPWTELVK